MRFQGSLLSCPCTSGSWGRPHPVGRRMSSKPRAGDARPPESYLGDEMNPKIGGHVP